MANVSFKKDKAGTPARNKDGSYSFQIKVFGAERPDGTQAVQNATYRTESNYPTGRHATALKKAQAHADDLERKARGRATPAANDKLTFEEYSRAWLEDTTNHAPKTLEQYEYLLTRINKSLGHLKLKKITENDLTLFYKSLYKDDVRKNGSHAIGVDFKAARKEAGYKTQEALSKAARVSICTVAAAEQGRNVSVENAKKLAKAIKRKMPDVFTITVEHTKLSDGTIWHHHKLLHTILEAAVIDEIIPINPAAQLAKKNKAPPRPEVEVKCLTMEQAQIFIEKLLNEPDIRIKTALVLAIFTGLRRGELAGLSWDDIDDERRTIKVLRASQYTSGKGVSAGQTKTKKSVRRLAVSQFVIDILKEYRRWWTEHRLMYGADWKGDEKRLFIQDDGKPIFPSTIYVWLQKFLERNGLPHVSLHSLRHTNLSLQVAQGVDFKTIQARSGHTKAGIILDTYSYYMEDTQSRAVEALDEVLLRGIKNG